MFNQILHEVCDSTIKLFRDMRKMAVCVDNFFKQKLVPKSNHTTYRIDSPAPTVLSAGIH